MIILLVIIMKYNSVYFKMASTKLMQIVILNILDTIYSSSNTFDEEYVQTIL